MILSAVEILNFRANRNLEAPCRHLTAFVGPNGSGKSSILHALDLFFHPERQLRAADFFNEKTDNPIEIKCTFTELPDGYPAEWAPYIQVDEETGNDTLTVTAFLEHGGGKAAVTYFAQRPVNKDFEVVRQAGAAPNVERAYKLLLDSGKYPELSPEKAKGRIFEALDKWEADPVNQARCERDRDSGAFFAMGKGGPGDLRQFVDFVLVPAVLDATQEVGGAGKGSMAQIIQRNILEPLLARPELQEIEDAAKLRLKELMTKPQQEAASLVESSLNVELGRFAKNATVSFAWQEGQVSVVPPSPSLRVAEDGFKTSVDGTGHGVQRALILTSIKHRAGMAAPVLSPAASDDVRAKPRKGLILGIEEPELYQHPNRQRHFADVLRNVAGADKRPKDERVQVLMVTHSPLFVNLHYFDCIRRTTKTPSGDDNPPATEVAAVDWEEVAEKYWKLVGKGGPKFTEETFRARLQGIMTPWLNEGFFAKKVVLVEGESDRAVLLAVAKDAGVNLEELEISVLPCGGKTNLDRPYLVFTELGIPTYIIWDSDDAADPDDKAENNHLFALVSSDMKDGGDAVESHYACFPTDLESYMKAEAAKVSDGLYQTALTEAKTQFGYQNTKNKTALKNPVLVTGFYERLRAAGVKFDKIEQMVRGVLDLDAPVPLHG
jgi:putative ATP-dependent endonuclease of OLD family